MKYWDGVKITKIMCSVLTVSPLSFEITKYYYVPSSLAIVMVLALLST